MVLPSKRVEESRSGFTSTGGIESAGASEGGTMLAQPCFAGAERRQDSQDTQKAQ